MQHKTVLLSEAVDGLRVSKNDIVVDATFGSGGHAKEIIGKLGKKGCYIGIDTDATAFNQVKLGEVIPRIHLVNDNFKNVSTILDSLNIRQVNAILADLGWRMEQFADTDKGFSFKSDGPLYMTFGDPKNYDFTAEDIINDWDEHVIADILFGYAEERFARRIAKGIVTARKVKRITSTFELVKIVENSLPKIALNKKIHPATKTFQGLRIAVNDELRVLEQFIKDGFSRLAKGGNMAIITFHSIEDRIVKLSFRELVKAGLGELKNKKPITSSEEELKANPRARSAKLRIIKKF